MSSGVPAPLFLFLSLAAELFGREDGGRGSRLGRVPRLPKLTAVGWRAAASVPAAAHAVAGAA
eukprot:6751547-Pyramimonas_sp.AAC.1